MFFKDNSLSNGKKDGVNILKVIKKEFLHRHLAIPEDVLSVDILCHPSEHRDNLLYAVPMQFYHPEVNLLHKTYKGIHSYLPLKMR